MHKEKLDSTNSEADSGQSKWSILENLKEAKRLAFDKIGIRPYRSEQHHTQEVKNTTLARIQQEEAERAIAEQHAAETAHREELERLREQARQLAAQKAQEEKAIGEDLVEYMDRYRQKKTERIQRERAQELVERDFAQKILTVETLEDKIADGDPGVSKHIELYGEKEVPVYTLQGLPFAMLTHTVEYKSRSGNLKLSGAQTAQKVVEDPSFWVRPLSEVIQDKSYGTDKPDATGNTISMSYTNSETNIDSLCTAGKLPMLIYGFNVSAGSIISTNTGDGMKPNVVNYRTKLGECDLDTVTQLEKKSSGLYNEVHAHRYTDEGEARRPSYIVTHDGKITDTMLRHADFYGIPIVNINQASYREESQAKVEKLLESFDESDSYSTIHCIAQEINTTSYYRGKVQLWDRIGDGLKEQACSEPKQLPDKSKLFELAKLEAKKFVDEFAPWALEEAIRQCKKATQEGIKFSIKLPGVKEIDFAFYDAHSGTLHGRYINEHKVQYPNAPDSIDIFVQDDEVGDRKIEVCDGENYNQHNLKSGAKQNVDSSHFEKLKPLVLEYLQAIQDNEKKLSQTRHNEL